MPSILIIPKPAQTAGQKAPGQEKDRSHLAGMQPGKEDMRKDPEGKTDASPAWHDTWCTMLGVGALRFVSLHSRRPLILAGRSLEVTRPNIEDFKGVVRRSGFVGSQPAECKPPTSSGPFGGCARSRKRVPPGAGVRFRGSRNSRSAFRLTIS